MSKHIVTISTKVWFVCRCCGKEHLATPIALPEGGTDEHLVLVAVSGRHIADDEWLAAWHAGLLNEEGR